MRSINSETGLEKRVSEPSEICYTVILGMLESANAAPQSLADIQTCIDFLA